MYGAIYMAPYIYICIYIYLLGPQLDARAPYRKPCPYIYIYIHIYIHTHIHFGGLPATSLLGTIEFLQRKPEWGQNTQVGSEVRTKYCSHTLSGSAKHYKTTGIWMISVHDLWYLRCFHRSEFWSRINRISTPTAHQPPTWSPDMERDCVKQTCPIATVNATPLFQAIEFFRSEPTSW